jgi:hypothetical protein
LTAAKSLVTGRFDANRYTCLWSQRVQLAINTGDYAAAEEAIPSRPVLVREAALAHRFQGQIAESRWHLEDAADHYRRAAALDGCDAGVHADLARLTLKLLNVDACRYHLRRLTNLSTSSKQLKGQSLNVSQTHIGQLLDEFVLDAPLRMNCRRCGHCHWSSRSEF